MMPMVTKRVRAKPSNSQREAAKLDHSDHHEFGWGLIAQFDPDVAARHLVSTESTYAGEREMIFAGLCAWTIAPADLKFVRMAIDLAGFRGFGDLGDRTCT